MPGPGAHLLYTLGVGSALSRLTAGRFGPHHCAVYAVNAFLGPDLGSFAEWLADNLLPSAALGGFAMRFVHDPFFYGFLLGFPLACFYSFLSARAARSGLLEHAGSQGGLSKRQCFMLVTAGGISHFFLDHLFEENGHTSMYTWILSTGWWTKPAPIHLDSVLVIGLLTSILLGGFVYIHRVKHQKSFVAKSNQSLLLILAIATLYCLWCSLQIYVRKPAQPAIGEEADLGVIVFLAIYFFLPHGLCILSMNKREHGDQLDDIPV